MSSQLVEYIKLHRLSLMQDMLDSQEDLPIPEDEYFEADAWYEAQIDVLDHILKVAEDIDLSRSNMVG